MSLINSVMTWVIKKRIHQMEAFIRHPMEAQFHWFHKLVQTARDTEYGSKYGFETITSIDRFREQVPLVYYEDLYPYIKRIMRGEQNLLWPTTIRWFAKSSGTTNDRSKFIPVSNETLEDCHFKCGKDMLALYINNYPDSRIFSGKGLGMGGSHQVNDLDPSGSSYYGDVSAVIMQNLPVWAQLKRTPGLDIALMDEWEEKIEKMARITSDQNITSISGVPTWTVLLLQRVLELKNADNILEIWPNLEVFFHGAVAFEPYRSLFHSLIPSDGMRYVDTYNASEGFFGIQYEKDNSDMLLMLDYGIFYEFIPIEEIENEHPRTLTLDEVELDKNYALVISTNGGLWRYVIGDTVKFTSRSPYRIRITGRTKHFINAFGEEVVIENAETAISKASELTGAIINNFTAAPKYLGDSSKGGHEWIIEFLKQPDDLNRFRTILDETLREINSDYDAKRYQDLALEAPTIHPVNKGTFYNWMKKRGKLGGQHKVPRLSNSREYLEDILNLVEA